MPPDEKSTLKQRLTQAAALLEQHGVELAVNLMDGMHTVNTTNVHEVVTDPDGWLAKVYGVPVERLQAWNRWIAESSQCTGTTRKGDRCQNCASHPYDATDPTKFVPGETDRCDLHVDVSRQTVSKPMKMIPKAPQGFTPMFLDDQDKEISDAQGVRELREQFGLSTTDVAKACQCSRRTVEGWEAGRNIGNVGLLALYALYDARSKQAGPAVRALTPVEARWVAKLKAALRRKPMGIEVVVTPEWLDVYPAGTLKAYLDNDMRRSHGVPVGKPLDATRSPLLPYVPNTRKPREKNPRV